MRYKGLMIPLRNDSWLQILAYTETSIYRYICNKYIQTLAYTEEVSFFKKLLQNFSMLENIYNDTTSSVIGPIYPGFCVIEEFL